MMVTTPNPETLSIKNLIAMQMLPARLICAFIAAALISFLYPSSHAKAASAVEIDAKANAALEEFFSKAPTGKELATKAAGVLIFPSVVKAGMLVGGEYGEGALRVGGTTVGYYSTASGSIGLQLGVQKKSIIIMFMDNSALDSFKVSDGWEVGVDGSVALIDTGAGASIDTNTVKQPVIGFIFSQKGFMGNLTLEGTKISRIIR